MVRISHKGGQRIQNALEKVPDHLGFSTFSDRASRPVWFCFGVSRQSAPLRRRLQTLDLDARDPPAIHFDNRKTIAIIIKTFAASRNKSELREHKTASVA